MKIAIASGNQGKINEFRKILEPLGYELLSAKELNVDMAEVIETGTTFAENAKLKSDFLFKKTQIASVADDSGLVVKALPDILGVTSARFMGENTDYKTKNQQVITLLQDKTDRRAYFESAISFTSYTEHKIFSGRVCGMIAEEVMGHRGFGYDPIFIPEGYEVSFGVLDETIKNQISHRANALGKFETYIHEK